MDKLTNIDKCRDILDDFIQKNSTSEEIHVTLAIDAASFKETKGETILKKFYNLKYIDPKKVYNNLFVFFIQPINIDNKPFPIYISLKENISASKETLNSIFRI